MELAMSPTDPPDEAPPAPHHRVSLKQAILRHLAGPPRVSQRDFAKRLGVNQSFISKIIHGKRAISWRRAFEIHAKTGIPLDDLRPPPKKRRKKKQPPQT
jgi:DNA-binding transcriptional regulator YdaS (Cro superfamily)